MGNQLKTNLFYGSLALLTTVFWAFATVFIKVVLDSFSPMYILAMRFSIAAICFAIIFHKRIFKNLANIKWIPCIIIGVCLAIVNLTLNYSLNLTTATAAAFFFSIPSLFTPFVGLLLFRYKVSVGHFGVVALVIVGLFMLCNTYAGFQFGFGEILGALSSLSLAFALVLQDRYLPEMDDITNAGLQVFIIAIVGWLIVLPTEGIMDFGSVSLSAWIMLIYMGIFGGFLAYIFQNITVNNMNANFVSVIFAAEPVFTAIIAYFILQEVMTPIAMIGAVLIMIGIVIVTLRGNKDHELDIKE